MKTSRVLRVQLIDTSEADRHDLMYRARESARFCNGAMADFYVRELGYTSPDDQSFFRRFGNSLSGDVKVSLQREAFTHWKRHRKDILLGKVSLATFRDKRALVCRAEHMSKGKRQRHAFVWSDGNEHYLNILLCGKNSPRIASVKRDKKGRLSYEWDNHGQRHQLKLWWKPQVDERNRPVMEGLANGNIRLLKVSFIFERPGNKIFALLTYEKWIDPIEPEAAKASLGPLEADGSLWLRIHGGQSHNFTHWVHDLLSKKEHFDGIHRRLRAGIRRTGPGHRQNYRRALLKAGKFSKYAAGRLHEMSAEIVKTLMAERVGNLAIGPIALGELPLYQLGEKLRYKMLDAGIKEVAFDPKDPVVARAMSRVLSKEDRSIRRAKESLRKVLKEIEEDK